MNGSQEETFCDPNNSTIDKAFLISQIRKLLDYATGKIDEKEEEGSRMDEGEDGEEEEDEVEKEMVESCCILWDISANSSHTNFLMEHQLFAVFYKILTAPHSERLIEVVLGTIGNMVSVSPVVAASLADDILADIILHAILFESDDPCVLSEVARIITSSVSTTTCRDKWIQKLKGVEHFIPQILNILANTLNTDLVDRMLTLVATLIHFPSFLEELIANNIAGLVCQLMKEITTNYSEVHENAIDLCFRIWEVLDSSPNLLSLLDHHPSILPSLAAIVTYSDNETLMESALQLLAGITSDASMLAVDRGFCEALLGHLSSDILSSLSLLMKIIDYREGLEVVLEQLDSLLGLPTTCNEEEELKKTAIEKISNVIEKSLQKSKHSSLYEHALRKIRH